MNFIRNPDTARRLRLAVSLVVSYFASFFIVQVFFLNNSPALNPQAFVTVGEKVSSAKNGLFESVFTGKPEEHQQSSVTDVKVSQTPSASVTPVAAPISSIPQLPNPTIPAPTTIVPTAIPTAVLPSPTTKPTTIPPTAPPAPNPTSSHVTYAQFGQCLNDKTMVMYMSATCSLCAQQKKTLKDAFNYIRSVDCNASQQNGLECSQVGVRGLPTWGKNGKAVLSGPQTNEALAQEAGCQAPDP